MNIQDMRAERDVRLRLQREHAQASAVMRAIYWICAVGVAIYPLWSAIRPVRSWGYADLLRALDRHHIFADLYYVQIICCAVLLTNLHERRWHAELVPRPSPRVWSRVATAGAFLFFLLAIAGALWEHSMLFSMPSVPLERMVQDSRSVFTVVFVGLVFEVLSGWAGHK